jgi:hypothetical protein
MAGLLGEDGEHEVEEWESRSRGRKAEKPPGKFPTA